MSRLRRLLIVSAIVAGLVLAGAAPTFASNVCPVIGGPDAAEIKGTPAEVPDKSGNPAHGTDPGDPEPGDAFWN